MLFSLPLLVSGNVFAMDKNYDPISIEINNKTDLQDISLITDASMALKFLKNYPSAIDGMNKVTIKININDKAKESTSNYDRKNCQIEINYTKDLKPYIYKNLMTDLMITSLHEIGHCVLGKEILYKTPTWKNNLNLTSDELQSFTLKIEEKRKKAFDEIKSKRKCSTDNKCIPQEVFNTYPPMLSYHETFADLWALAKYSEISCNDSKEIIETLENYRSKNFLKNPQVLNQSFLATYYMRDIWECGKKFDFDELNFYTQKGLIDYLGNQ